MNRKIIAGFSLGMLVIAFGAVSVLVVLSRRHPFFVEKKLRLGALILTLSGVVAACGCGSPVSPQVMCYDPIPKNYVTIDRYDYSKMAITVSRTDTINGSIIGRNDTVFSYMITDTSGAVFHKNNLPPADGIFDESAEEFTIIIPESIPPGAYRLDIAAVPEDSIETAEYSRQSFNLIVTE